MHVVCVMQESEGSEESDEDEENEESEESEESDEDEENEESRRLEVVFCDVHKNLLFPSFCALGFMDLYIIVATCILGFWKLCMHKSPLQTLYAVAAPVLV